MCASREEGIKLWFRGPPYIALFQEFTICFAGVSLEGVAGGSVGISGPKETDWSTYYWFLPEGYEYM